MKPTQAKNSVLSFLLLFLAVTVYQCASPPSSAEWQQINKELIKQHNLTERELSGLPQPAVASNLVEGKVKSLDSLATTTLHPGVAAKIFWGNGNMTSLLQLQPGAKIPDESLPAVIFLYVPLGSSSTVELFAGLALNC